MVRRISLPYLENEDMQALPGFSRGVKLASLTSFG